jgi:phosphoglycerol transferase
MTAQGPKVPSITSKQAASPNDGVVMGVLLILVFVAWAGAYAKWSFSAWAAPIRYLDPVYADFIGASAAFKTMAHENLWPLSERVASNLGAPTPGGVNSTASPTTNEIETTLAGILTWAWGLFAGINATFCIGHLATAASFYVVARKMSAAPAWSFVGGLAYGLAPYLFAQTPHHITCQFIFYVPLYALVWHWLCTPPGLAIGSRRFWAAAAIAFLSGMENPYFTNILCQLALLGGAVLAWQTRSWGPFAAAAAVVGAAAIGFGFINIETLVYRISNPALGDHAGAILNREYRWMDIYGLKLVDLFIPSVSHHSAVLAKFGFAHRQATVLNDEEGCAYLGILGAACLIWMTGFSVRAFVERRYSDVPIATWQVLWVVLMFTTGGMNAIVAAFTGFTLFRTACRYSVIILLITLIWAVTRLTSWQQKAEKTWPEDSLRIAVASLVLGLVALVWWDQVPRVASAEQRQLIHQQVQSDRQFAEAMEQSLPAGAMVFQLPVMDASGSPIPGVPPYDHYRLYLYSKDLKISFGATPGDAVSTWQHAAQRQLTTGAEIDQEKQILRFNPKQVAEALMQIQKAGFAALYVNRNGFPDGGKGLEAALRELGYTKPPIESTLGDLVCFVLEKE